MEGQMYPVSHNYRVIRTRLDSIDTSMELPIPFDMLVC